MSGVDERASMVPPLRRRASEERSEPPRWGGERKRKTCLLNCIYAEMQTTLLILTANYNA